MGKINQHTGHRTRRIANTVDDEAALQRAQEPDRPDPLSGRPEMLPELPPIHLPQDDRPARGFPGGGFPGGGRLPRRRSTWRWRRIPWRRTPWRRMGTTANPNAPTATRKASGRNTHYLRRRQECHVLAGALSKFKVLQHFRSLDHTLMERSLFCTLVHLYSWCNR